MCEPDAAKAHALLWRHIVGLMDADDWDNIWGDHHALVKNECICLSELPKMPKIEMGELAVNGGAKLVQRAE